MATKIDIEDIQMILAAKDLGIAPDKQQMIIEELQALAEQVAPKTGATKNKNEFLVMPIVIDEDEQDLFKDRSYVIIQVPKDSDPNEALNLIELKMNEVSNSKSGKKNGLNKASLAIGKIKAKELLLTDGKKITIKTKIPVQGIPVINSL